MNEVKVDFPSGVDYCKAPQVTQWDYNRKLYITGLPTGSTLYQVHFSNKISAKSTVRIAYQAASGGAYEASIPNRLLEEQFDISAVVYINNYERAYNVDIATKGTYYIRSGNAATGYIYTKKTLPDQYISGTDYYKQEGATIKRILIPVLPRPRPELPLDREDPTDEELVNELIGYCSNLSTRLNETNANVAKYKAKAERELVQPVTMAEYEMLVMTGEMENGVIYAVDSDEDFFNEVVEAATAGVDEKISEKVGEAVAKYAHYLKTSKFVNGETYIIYGVFYSSSKDKILANNVFPSFIQQCPAFFVSTAGGSNSNIGFVSSCNATELEVLKAGNSSAEYVSFAPADFAETVEAI